MLLFLKSEKNEKEEILKAFKLFDDDDTGSITLNNIKRVAKELGENLTDDELKVIFYLYNYNLYIIYSSSLNLDSNTFRIKFVYLNNHLCHYHF